MPLPERKLFVFDGTSWFVRRVRVIEHDLERDEKVYRCDKHLGGPFSTVAECDERVQVLEYALLEAAKDHINPEGTFGEAMKRKRQIDRWIRRAKRELRSAAAALRKEGKQ